MTARLLTILDIMLLRFMLDRVANTSEYTLATAGGRLFTGVHMQATGAPIDLRSECAAYTRTVLTTTTGGVMSCSLMRMLIRVQRVINIHQNECILCARRYVAETSKWQNHLFNIFDPPKIDVQKWQFLDMLSTIQPG